VDETLRAADGIELRQTGWPAVTAPPRAALVIVHGLGEHAGRHDGVASQLAARGFDVHAYDQRGHGRSGGPRGGLPRSDALLADLALVIDRLRKRWPGPLVLVGHSMGGLVAARFVTEALQATPAPWSRPVDALVLSSPALAAELSTVQRALLAVGALVPDLPAGNGLRPEWISRDPAVVRAYVGDPLVHDRVTPRLARFILQGAGCVLASAPRWRTPTLLMWAGADRCVAPRGSAQFAAAAPTAVVQSHRFDDLFHEILNEPERDLVLGHLVEWLDARFPPRAYTAQPE
jgi:alpha-beta hydrolase superfamily lysophospholipase